MRSWRYGHLSRGYLGQAAEGTLNAQFLGHCMIDQLHLRHEFLRFPQRVPRLDFFAEIASLESEEFANEFQRVQQTVQDQLAAQVQQPSDGLPLLNTLKLALRLGMAANVLKLPTWEIPDIDVRTHCDLQRETARINFSVSREEPVALDAIIAMVNRPGISPYTRISLKLRVVVASARYARGNKVYGEKAEQYAAELMTERHELDQSHFADRLLHAMVLRGTPMVQGFSPEEKDVQLAECIERAENLQPESTVETILAQENLLTIHQSMSKWYGFRKRDDDAEDSLQQMCRLDPFDSTGFSELGIFLSDRDRPQEAFAAFEKAVSLGPPSVSMNAYFAGELAYQLDRDDAIAWLEQSMAADEVALSPRLRLVDILIETSRSDEARDLAREIITNNDLADQLEDEERAQLMTIAGSI